MRYMIKITRSDFVQVDAMDETAAIELVKNNLVQTGQMKPCDPVEFDVVTEVDLENNK